MDLARGTLPGPLRGGGFVNIVFGHSEDETNGSLDNGRYPALKELSSDLKRRMDQAVATFSQLGINATGRASVHMLDR